MLVWWPWICRISCTLVDCICYVWAIEFSKKLSWPSIHQLSHKVSWSGPLASLCSILLDSSWVPFGLVLSLNPNAIIIRSISSGCDSLMLPSLLLSTLTPRYSSTSTSSVIFLYCYLYFIWVLACYDAIISVDHHHDSIPVIKTWSTFDCLSPKLMRPWWDD